MSDKDTTASSPSPTSGEAQVEATEEALESRGQLGRDYLWNTAASLMSSLAVVIMGVAIMRSGATDSFARAQYGLFTLALAIGQQYQTVGLYEVRTFHVTDVRRRFDFGTYLSTRLLTCLVMVGLIAYHSWTASTKDPYPAFTVIAAMALLRIFDAFEDVYYSEFQRAGRLDIAGKACFLRIFTTTFLWSGLYWFTQDLFTSTLITFAVTCVVLVVAYGLPARGVFPLLPSFNLRGIAGILWECLPLFLAAFLNQYLANAPRFAIHAALGDEELGVFAIIYMPAVAINMLSLFVFRPLLTRMALRWAEGKRDEFFAIVRKGLLTTAGAFVIVAAVTYVIGSPLLTLVFGTDVSGYVAELMVLVLAGALNAASVILYYALATMRRLHAVLAVFAVTGATAYLIAPALTQSYAMMGASLAYAATMGLLALLFTVVMLIPTRRAPVGTEPTTD